MQLVGSWRLVPEVGTTGFPSPLDQDPSPGDQRWSAKVYRSQQRVFYGGESAYPDTFYGWQIAISGRSGGVDVHPFGSRAEREGFVAHVRAVLAPGPDHLRQAEEHQAEEHVAALLAMGHCHPEHELAESLLSSAIGSGRDELHKDLHERLDWYMRQCRDALARTQDLPSLGAEQGFRLEQRIEELVRAFGASRVAGFVQDLTSARFPFVEQAAKNGRVVEGPSPAAATSFTRSFDSRLAPPSPLGGGFAGPER